jgi:PKD repeat protein
MARRCTGLGLFAAILASVFAVAIPAAALAHESAPETVQGHIAEDSVAHDPAAERQLGEQTRAATASDAQAAEALAAGDEGQVGRWGPVAAWPVVGVHVALLENGKVLAWDSVGDRATETYPVHDHTRATVWDPATGTHSPVNVNTGYNVFCSGLAHLMDGSLFLAGGNKNAQLQGIVQTHIFDSDTNTWSLGPNMAAGRWYPSVTPLHNGEMLITEGGPDMPEVRKTDGSLRALNTASLNLPLYPWLDVAPNGRAFYSGPDQTMRSLNPAGGGSWQSFGQRDSLNRDYGSRALYDVGKILVAGGGNSSKDARVINLNGATPQVSATAPMAFGRRQHNLTVLADGSVLATGGNSSGASLVDLNNGVYPAELWNPATGQWQTLAAMQTTRQYHSTALLMPDGRVLSSGGGICGTCDQVGYLAKNAEVFSPPYLFKKDGSGQLAPRPQITAAPGEVGYNTPFTISTPNAAAIGKVALARLGAVTHSVDMEQRYVPLSFTAASGAVNVTGPANANVAPPGVYMLFVIGTEGVPSVAKMVRVGEPSPNRPPTAVATGTPTSGTSPLTVEFDGTESSDPDPGDSLTFAWDLDGDGAYDDSSSSSPSHTYTAIGDHTARLRVTDRRGASDTAAVTISVGNSAPTATITTPGSATTWSVGDRIEFAGSATDPDDGPLPASALSWSILLHHCPSSCHTHPLPDFPGVANGSFTAPDHELPAHLELRLTARDTRGLTDTRSVRLDPRTVTLNFRSNPDGLQLAVDGTAANAPFTRTVIANSTHTISATSPQNSQGKTWEFTSWSDGGSQTHQITADRDTTHTATFRETAAQCGGGVGGSLILVGLCSAPYLRRRAKMRRVLGYRSPSRTS